MLSQVHGTAAHVLLGVEDPEEVARSVGDVALTQEAGVACGVRTADCVPVLVADRRTGAVAAIHSGWRGTVAGVVGVGIDALRTLVDGEGDLVVAIGPHIASCCFEVGDDVAEALLGCSPAGKSALIAAPDGKPHVDLCRIVHAQLAEAGVDADRIDDVVDCTVCNRARFHSFRRDGQHSGRMLSAIVASPRPG
jgi:YfiH family protein